MLEFILLLAVYSLLFSFLLSSIHASQLDGSQTDTLYAKAISTLESISSSNLHSSSPSQEVPLLYRLFKNVFRGYWERFWRNEGYDVKVPFQSNKNKKEMAAEQPLQTTNNIPEFKEGDNVSVKRAKAILILESLHSYPPSLMTLGDMFLVKKLFFFIKYYIFIYIKKRVFKIVFTV